VAPRQLDLFGQPTIGGLVRDLKLSMSQVVKNSGLSRAQVLDLLNDFAQQYRVKLNGGNAKMLSGDTLEKWLNPGDEARVPSMVAVTVFCVVMRTSEPISVMARLLGSMVIDGEEIDLLEWAKLQRQMKATRAKMRKIEAEW